MNCRRSRAAPQPRMLTIGLGKVYDPRTLTNRAVFKRLEYVQTSNIDNPAATDLVLILLDLPITRGSTTRFRVVFHNNTFYDASFIGPDFLRVVSQSNLSQEKHNEYMDGIKTWSQTAFNQGRT